jgi:putative transposase
LGVGKKRVYRLYRLEGLQLRMKVKRRKRISLQHRFVAPIADRHKPGR